MKHKLIAAFLLVALLISPLAYSSDLDKGIEAFQKFNYTQAYQILKPIAEKGNSDAQFYMGVIHSGVIGFPKDLDEASRWYTASAEQGNADAMFELYHVYNRRYFDARSTGSNATGANMQALYWLRKSAEHGKLVAQTMLASRYKTGDHIAQNDASAMYWFHRAAKLGGANEQFDLAREYDEGQIVPQNYVEAFRWYLLAAEQGLDIAQYNVGIMYYVGQGVPQNYTESYRWFRLAAEQGNSGAQYNLGLAYGKGEGVIQNYVRSHMWLNISASQGYAKASSNRDIVAGWMNPSQIQEAQRLAQQWVNSR